MTRLRPLFLLLLLCGFLFRWEMEQIGMWSSMIRNASPSLSLAQAVDDALSGEKPCPNCLRLTAQKTASDTDEALVAGESPALYLMLCPGPTLPAPGCKTGILFPFLRITQTAPGSAPALPPPIFNS